LLYHFGNENYIPPITDHTLMHF